MKTIIAGSRSILRYEVLLDAMLLFNNVWEISEIVSGTANGIDKLGERYARENNIPLKQFPANWDLYGKRAGYVRNRQMAAYADAVIVIWDGRSKGTKQMIEVAEEKGLASYAYISSTI